MSQTANPYAPSSGNPPQGISIRKVQVHVIELFRRSFELLGDQYWLFLGITVLAMLIGSAVPLGLIMGPVLVGIYACYIERERRGRVEFSTMFDGFDNFLEPFLAFLVILAAGLIVALPLTLGVFAAVFFSVMAAASATDPSVPAVAPAIPIFMILVLVPVSIVLQLLVTMPFLFTFQLIADRKLKAVESIKLSIQGVLQNFWGVLWCLIGVTFVSFLATLMCYFPMFLLMPVTFGVFYLLYRDIFGPLPELPAAPEAAGASIDAEVVE